MSDLKATPGPWTALDGMDARVKCPDGRTFFIGDTIYHPENTANANLIAAAPDLYAALKAMADQSYGNPSMPDRNRAIDAMAEAALAKAEGR